VRQHHRLGSKAHPYPHRNSGVLPGRKIQLKNKAKALKVLRSRLYDLELRRKQDKEASERRSQIGSGDRSEKIRTYNFPQGRVTDHRIKLTIHRIDAIMDGDLTELTDSLIAADQAARLSGQST
jgi:peptide chain release factor 1